jgi:hypothetical protein
MRFSPDGTARMLTHGGSVAHACGAPTLRTDYGQEDKGSIDPLDGAALRRDHEDMGKSVEGIYRNGKVELVEPLAERGIDEPQAADLRRRLAPFAEDWDRPEMAAYDELPPR